MVVGAGEHPPELERFERAAELALLALDLAREVGVGVLGVHLGERLDVLLQLDEPVVGVDPVLLGGDVLLDLLGRLGVVPEPRLEAFLLQCG
jgi:hypothetical protein